MTPAPLRLPVEWLCESERTVNVDVVVTMPPGPIVTTLVRLSTLVVTSVVVE